MDDDVLGRVLARIDDANAADPNVEITDGVPAPRELAYGRRMSGWLDHLRPGAPPTLQIAARGQHIRRWEHPRDTYPEGRRGYLQWRRAMYGFHADAVADIMAEEGCGEAAIARVRSLLHKQGLGEDPDAQALEDAACLVFLERQFAEFAQRTPRGKMIGILRKTWRKMSPEARDEARKLPLPPEAADLVAEALDSDAS